MSRPAPSDPLMLEAVPVLDTLLAVAGLSCALGKRTVLHGIGFEVRRGEMLALAGANGTGKSTLLRVLAGIRRPVAGEVRLDGAPLGRLS
jgi:iron complex transport system ATP-binding protein